MPPGTILFHKNFAFFDGSSADKFLIVLGATPAYVIVAKTTSNGSRYRLDHGCQAGSYFAAFLLTKGCCCLPMHSWVCLSEFYEITLTDLNSRVVSGDVRKYGSLNDSLTRDLQFCAVGCDDISTAQEAVVRASFVPASP
jgi:hypothetical protein